jgi:photosystem II stability/assembly factor-like uncharacterized protein
MLSKIVSIYFVLALSAYNPLSASGEEKTQWKNISPATDSVIQLIAHPTNPNLQFAVTRNNLYRSANSGKFWQPLYLKHVESITINSSGTYLLAITNNYPVERQLWISKNEGSNFSLIGSFPGNQIFTSPDDNIFFANGCLSWGFCRSTDGGQTWKDFRNFPDGSPVEPENKNLNYLVQSVGFPSNNINEIYISGIYQHRHGAWSFPFFYITDNGGKNWKRIAHEEVFFIKQTDALYVYGCHGIKKIQNGSFQRISDQPLNSMIFVPDNSRLLWGINDCDPESRTILSSKDSGASWIEQSPFFHLDVTSISAVSENLTLFGTSGGGVYKYFNGKWYRESTGFIKPVVNNIASSLQSENLYSTTGEANYPALDNRFLQRFNSGAGWSDITKQINLRDDVYGHPEYFKEVKIDPFDSNHVVVTIGNSSGIFRTVQTYDGGKSWSPLPIPNEDFIHSKLRFNPYKKGVMHFFDSRSLVFKSSDSGLTFQRLPLTCSACPRPIDILNEISYDPFNDQRFYLLIGNKIFKTNNGGMTIKEPKRCNPCTTMNFPKWIRSFVALSQPNLLLAFTRNAVYETTDGAAHWKLLQHYTLGEIIQVISLDSHAEMLAAIIQDAEVSPDYRFYKRFAISTDHGRTWTFTFPSSLQQNNVLDIQPGAARNEAIVATDSGLYRVLVR